MNTGSDHSDGQGEMKEKKVHKIPWRLINLRQDKKEGQIQGELIMPSKIPPSYKADWVCPPVMMDLHADDDTLLHGLNIMRESTSRNILRASLIMNGASRKGASRKLAWVEPFSGNLLDYLLGNNLGISELDPGSKIVLPTPIMDSSLSQCVDGIEDLRISGNYHGNFALARTYYVIDQKTSACQVKLCNFRKKSGGTYDKYLSEDWADLLAELNQILAIANTLKSKYTNLDCSQLEGLIYVMGGINKSNAEVAFGLIKKQPFFWGIEERKSFFIYYIPLAFEKPWFFSKVEKENRILLPWSQHNFHGLLQEMNQYRLARGQDAYDTSSRTGLVKFVSGLYTHEHQLKSQIDVDVVIQTECPDLCYILYALLHVQR